VTEREVTSQQTDVDLHAPISRSSPSTRAAFRATFDEHFEHVWHTLRKLGVRDADLEDLTHEVFVTFHRRREDYDPARPLRPWLAGIALRVAAAHRRLARQKAETLGDGGEAERAADAAPLPDQTLARKQDRELLFEALAALDLDRRAVFVMHELDGMAMPEIAHALGIPLDTGYSRLRLARDELKAAAHRLMRRRR
jgi:RNA polymerase sigma-70 factor, ECF subfamily